MNPLHEHRLGLTRRRFFGLTAQSVGAGLGGLALNELLAGEALASEPRVVGPVPKAKRVIYLHMEGAPSQLDLFDYKPGLAARFAPVARALEENEQKIIEELDAAQGSPQDLGGYYRPEPERADAAMRPSATLNEIIAGI